MISKEPRKLLFAFMNGSHKKFTDVIDYDHKEWIVVTRSDGRKSFINSENVEWVDEVTD